MKSSWLSGIVVLGFAGGALAAITMDNTLNVDLDLSMWEATDPAVAYAPDDLGAYQVHPHDALPLDPWVAVLTAEPIHIPESPQASVLQQLRSTPYDNPQVYLPEPTTVGVLGLLALFLLQRRGQRGRRQV